MKRTALKRTAFKVKKRSEKTRTKQIEAKLDDLWSNAVKVLAGHKCEMATLLDSPCEGPLESHHIQRRRHKLTRFLVENGCCTCSRHHAELHADIGVEYENCYLLKGEGSLNRMSALAQTQYIRPDYEALEKSLKQILKENTQ